MYGWLVCDGCGWMLIGVDLVLLLSVLVLWGWCWICGVVIDLLYWWVEVVGLVIGLVVGVVVLGFEGVVGVVFGWLLLVFVVFDLVVFWLFDWLIVLLVLGGVGVGWLGFVFDLFDCVIGGIVGFVVLWGIVIVYCVICKCEGMGGGDFKLFGVIGLWLGW